MITLHAQFYEYPSRICDMLCCMYKINQVQSNHNVETENLATNVKSLEKLLTLVQSTNASYEKNLSPGLKKSGSGADSNSILGANEIKAKIVQCEKEYEKEISNSLNKISKNNTIYELHYNLNDIKQMMVDTELIAIRSKNGGLCGLDKMPQPLKVEWSHELCILCKDI